MQDDAPTQGGGYSLRADSRRLAKCVPRSDRIPDNVCLRVSLSRARRRNKYTSLASCVAPARIRVSLQSAIAVCHARKGIASCPEGVQTPMK